MNRALIALLRALERDGSVPASRLRTRAAEALRPLIETGVLAIQRSGAGERLVTRKPAELAAFVARLFPEGLAATGREPESRARSISVSRDSKHVAPAAPPILMFRGLPGTAISSATSSLPIGELTARHGASALMPAYLNAWWSSEPVAVVENLEVFARFEDLRERGLPARLALYSSGRLDGRILAWLGCQQEDIWHCGDYDATGLNEYLRLRSTCGRRARLFVPSDLETLFRTFGNPSLGGVNSELRQRTSHLNDQQVLRVVRLIQQSGCGLEQEILLAAPNR